MNKMPYIHYKKDKKDLIHIYYVAVFLLILFSIYKNGILLYQNGLIHFSSIFLPVYFYVVSTIVGFLLAILLKKNKKEMILLCLIISCSVSINTNMIFYPILLFIGIFIGEYLLGKTHISFNLATFSRLLLVLSLLLQSYSYLNIGEKLGKFNYGLFDIFLGFGTGGLATSSLLLILICFSLFCFNRFYKKVIPATAAITFLFLGVISVFLFNNYEFLKILCNGTIYFSFIFFAPTFYDSPLDKQGMLIYGIFIGLLTFIFVFLLNIYEAGILSIFIASFFVPLINKLMNKKYYKKK